MTALALAFSAGMVATLNPCGFAMLPAYLSYFIGIKDGDRSRAAAMRGALAVGGVVSAGFLLVFGVAGIIITAVSRTVATTWIPWLALAVGVGIGLLGIAMLFGYELTVGLPKAQRAGRGQGYGAVFGFGVSYAVASLSCTLPVFLTVVATQITQRSFVGGIVVFVAYAVGMASVLLGITVVMALGKQSLVTRLRSSARYINRVSGAILVAAGAWIVWFWATALSSGAGALGASAQFQFVENLSQTALNFIADNTLASALVLGAIVTGAAAYAWGGLRTGGSSDGGARDLETVGAHDGRPEDEPGS